ncbi:MAG: hypothetical protein LBH22_02120 [Bacteroidales bacterium]|jgi:hypothetical protein|nr:hypothetical protein [Bacteroidales bacterium]
MKKITFSLITVLATMVACSQTNSNPVAPSDNVVYRLFPTENVWTFIKLNTRNGQMWQVQYDVQGDNRGDNRGEVSLSSISLVPRASETNGRFTLYPTQNMWTFILLDQIDGNMWQVQWSKDANNRGIIPMD